VFQRHVIISCEKITDAAVCTIRIIDDGKIKYVPARYSFV